MIVHCNITNWYTVIQTCRTEHILQREYTLQNLKAPKLQRGFVSYNVHKTDKALWLRMACYVAEMFHRIFQFMYKLQRYTHTTLDKDTPNSQVHVLSHTKINTEQNEMLEANCLK